MIEAGKLRQRIRVLSKPTTKDALGKVDQTAPWTLVATRWGSVEPLSGREFLQAKQVEAEATHKVTLRHYPTLTPRHRLQVGSRVFEVVSVLNPVERDQATIALCVER